MPRIWYCITIAILISNIAIAQNDSLIASTDSLKKITGTADSETNIVYSKANTENTSITFPGYFVLLVNDFKQDFTSPFHQTGKEWIRTGIYAASVATFSAIADEPVQRLAVKAHDNSKTLSGASSFTTQFGGRYEIYTLAALGGYGFIFNNKKLQTTTLLATQAYLTSGLIGNIMKAVTGRQRPSYYDPNHPEPEPSFHGPFYKKGVNVSGNAVNSSFPSGHTTVIFAAATVFAKQYKNIPWVPAVSYTAASLVGISRITENKHWATDVIVGATLGYLCGNQVVNNYHRYAKIKASRKSGVVSFNLNYNGNNFEPGLVYTLSK